MATTVMFLSPATSRMSAGSLVTTVIWPWGADSALPAAEPGARVGGPFGLVLGRVQVVLQPVPRHGPAGPVPATAADRFSLDQLLVGYLAANRPIWCQAGLRAREPGVIRPVS
jgi:hypothetical protein